MVYLIHLPVLVLYRISSFLNYNECIAVILLSKDIDREPFVHRIVQLRPQFYFNQIVELYDKIGSISQVDTTSFDDQIMESIRYFIVTGNRLERVVVGDGDVDQLVSKYFEELIYFYESPCLDIMSTPIHLAFSMFQ